MGGVPGANGASVLKPVAVDHSIVNDPVPDPLQVMEENHAWDWTKRLEGATQCAALVRIVNFSSLAKRTNSTEVTNFQTFPPRNAAVHFHGLALGFLPGSSPSSNDSGGF